MKCRPVRHGPCCAHHDRGLRQGGSRHEQQAGVYALRLSRACVRMRDGDGEEAAEAEQGREGQEFLRAGLVKRIST